MHILIFDDTQANIAAAKEAGKVHPEHEFVFCTTATEALAKLEEGKIDGLISDFFAPIEQGKVEELWQEYLRPLGLYYRFYNHVNTAEDLKEWRRTFGPKDLSTFGSIFEPSLHLAPSYSVRGGKTPVAWHIEQVLGENSHELLSREHGYGGCLMQLAIQSGIPSVLVTNLHRHGLPVEEGGVSLGYFGVLAPLMAKISPIAEFDEEVDWNLIWNRIFESQAKDQPETWEKAIQKLEAQLG